MKLLLAIFLISHSLQLFSYVSPQRPDYLIYKGDTLAFYDLLLEEYLESINEENRGTLFGLHFREYSTFHCWRGYQAIFSIENDSLFLKHMLACYEIESAKPDWETSAQRMEKLFGNRIKSKKVHVNWKSGNLFLPSGPLLRFDGVFHKSFEKENLIKIRAGIVVRTKLVENYIDLPKGLDRKNKDRKEIKNLIFERLKSLDWKRLDDVFCDGRLLFIINKKGKIRMGTFGVRRPHKPNKPAGSEKKS